MIAAIIFSVMAYFLGSLSSAVIVSKIFNLPDPREGGSNNPGATNVLRIGGKAPALITLMGDFLKGWLPVTMATMAGISGFAVGIIALAAVVGHIFPIFFNFRGGKGVATSMGVWFGIAPVAGLLIGLCWLGVAYFYRYSSLAAMISALFASIAILFFGPGACFLPMLVVAALLIWRHLDNIQRLRAGTEGKINF
jgi:glycerol-3-phosphate acyltransferase PlsY